MIIKLAENTKKNDKENSERLNTTVLKRIWM